MIYNIYNLIYGIIHIYILLFRRHDPPAEPRDPDLCGDPGDGRPLHGAALPEGETQAVQGQGAGALA